MTELYIQGWGDDFMIEGEVMDETSWRVLEDSIPNPPTPMGRVVGEVIVNDFPISAIDRTHFGTPEEPGPWFWVFHKAP